MKQDKLLVGWKEWVRLPELGVRLVQAKVDSGAQTSALHAEEIQYVRRGTRRLVRFKIYPKSRCGGRCVEVTVPLVDQRRVRSSNGSLETRPVISTTVEMGGSTWPIEITLTSRELMGVPMLLGRQALRGHAVIDPGRLFVTLRKRRKTKRR